MMKISLITATLLTTLWMPPLFAEISEVTVLPQDSAVISVAWDEEGSAPSSHSAVPPSALRSDTEHHSMITHHGEGVFSMDPRFANARKDLIDMNDLSYAIGKEFKFKLSGDKEEEAKQKAKADRLMAKFKQEGWEIKTFEGVSGVKNPVKDIVGFVAYNAKTNQMNVIFRGSASAADWEINYDALKVKAKDIGLNLEGMVHQGFARKYMTARDNMIKAIESFWEKMTDHAKKAVKIIVSGHSQGGGLATLGIADIGINLSKKLFGEGYNNARDNQIYMWSLSGARAGDATAIDDINAKIGVYNMIRQNPYHDPVPNAALGRTGQRIFEKIPIVGHYLAENFAGYKSVGTLALANDYETFLENEVVDSLVLAVKRTANDVVEDIKSIKPDFILHPLDSLKSIGSFFKRTGERVTYMILSPLHQGGTVTDESGVFSPTIVNMDTARLLHDGWEHKKKSQESRGETYIYEQPFGSGVSEYSSPKPPPEPVKEEGLLSRAATAVKDTVVNTATAVKDGVVNAASKVKEGVTNAASKVKEGFKKLKFW